jgi:hypothetical protein
MKRRLKQEKLIKYQISCTVLKPNAGSRYVTHSLNQKIEIYLKIAFRSVLNEKNLILQLNGNGNK